VAQEAAVNGPDFDRMSQDEVLGWFDTTEDISPMLATL